MRLEPSDLPVLMWWEWLIFSMTAWLVCIVAFASRAPERLGILNLLFAFVSGVVAILTGSLAAVYFVLMYKVGDF